MSEELKQNILIFFEKCETDFIGKKTQIYEALSAGEMLFDRHSTTYGNVEFVLESLHWQISGGRIIFQGEIIYYEIGSHLIVAFTETNQNEYEIMEKYTENCFRRSCFKFMK